MSDAVPIVIGLALTLVLVRWIFNNRVPEQTRAPPQEAVDQLLSMFPNVPIAVIRSELVRGGSIQAAIERLLSVSANYPARMPTGQNPSSASSSTKSSLSHIKDLPEGPEEGPIKVDADTWIKDQMTREQLLLRRKQEMLLRARKYKS